MTIATLNLFIYGLVRFEQITILPGLFVSAELCVLVSFICWEEKKLLCNYTGVRLKLFASSVVCQEMGLSSL